MGFMMRASRHPIFQLLAALRPFLFYSALCMAAGVPLLLLGAVAAKVIGAVLVLHHIPVTVTAALYLLFKDPNRLGSEVFMTQQGLMRFAEAAKDSSMLPHLGEAMALMRDPSPPATPKALGSSKNGKGHKGGS